MNRRRIVVALPGFWIVLTVYLIFPVTSALKRERQYRSTHPHWGTSTLYDEHWKKIQGPTTIWGFTAWDFFCENWYNKRILGLNLLVLSVLLWIGVRNLHLPDYLFLFAILLGCAGFVLMLGFTPWHRGPPYKRNP